MTMRYNTLQLTNKILNALDLQAVSTLGETEDAEQVLSLLDRAFADLELDIDWFSKRDVVSLSTASGTTQTNWLINYPAIPWAMAIPVGVEAVYEVYYNNKIVHPVTPELFHKKIENGTAFKSTGDPTIWTMGVRDEDYILFDNFDSVTETRLTSVNSSVRVTKVSRASLAADTDEIELSEKYLGALLHKSISYGFIEMHKDLQKGAFYNSQYNIAKAKLNANHRRFKPESYLLGAAFPKTSRSGSFRINDSQYTDVSSQP